MLTAVCSGGYAAETGECHGEMAGVVKTRAQGDFGLDQRGMFEELSGGVDAGDCEKASERHFHQARKTALEGRD